MAVREKEDFPSGLSGIRSEKSGLDNVLNIAEADMLFLSGEAGIDPFRKDFQEGQDIPVSWPINCRRPENDKGNFMYMFETELLSLLFAPSIRGDRFAMV